MSSWHIHLESPPPEQALGDDHAYAHDTATAADKAVPATDGVVGDIHGETCDLAATHGEVSYLSEGDETKSTPTDVLAAATDDTFDDIPPIDISMREFEEIAQQGSTDPKRAEGTPASPPPRNAVSEGTFVTDSRPTPRQAKSGDDHKTTVPLHSYEMRGTTHLVSASRDLVVDEAPDGDEPPEAPNERSEAPAVAQENARDLTRRAQARRISGNIRRVRVWAANVVGSLRQRGIGLPVVGLETGRYDDTDSVMETTTSSPRWTSLRLVVGLAAAFAAVAATTTAAAVIVLGPVLALLVWVLFTVIALLLLVRLFQRVAGRLWGAFETGSSLLGASVLAITFGFSVTVAGKEYGFGYSRESLLALLAALGVGCVVLLASIARKGALSDEIKTVLRYLAFVALLIVLC